MDYRTFKKAAKDLNILSKADLKRAFMIAKKLDDDQRASFADELSKKYTALNEVVEKTSAFIEDYSGFVSNSEKSVQKVETKEQEEQEKVEDISAAEKHISDYTQT